MVQVPTIGAGANGGTGIPKGDARWAQPDAVSPLRGVRARGWNGYQASI